MINVENIPFSFLYEVPKATLHKENIIKLIQKIPENKFNEISHTDINLPTGFKREYYEYFIENVYNNFEKEFSNHTRENLVLQNAWFQWYNKDDYHPWHVHPCCHFTSIYFLNHEDKSLTTKIKFLNKEYLIEVGEGQIITMPAFFVHQSPLNKNNAPKIIISFNTSIKGRD